MGSPPPEREIAQRLRNVPPPTKVFPVFHQLIRTSFHLYLDGEDYKNGLCSTEPYSIIERLAEKHRSTKEKAKLTEMKRLFFTLFEILKCKLQIKHNHTEKTLNLLLSLILSGTFPHIPFQVFNKTSSGKPAKGILFLLQNYRQVQLDNHHYRTSKKTRK